MCGGKVYLLERHIDGSTLYHRHCFRASQRAQPSTKANGLHPGAGNFNNSSKAKVTEPQNKSRLVGLGKERTINGSADVRQNANAQARKAPHNSAQPANSTVERIAEMLNEPNREVEKKTPSKNLLLLGQTTKAYKSAPEEKDHFSHGKKTSPSLDLNAPVGSKTHITTSTDKPGYNVMGQDNTKPATTWNTRQSEKPGTHRPTAPKGNTTSDSSVVSGLLHSLAEIRNHENTKAANKSALTNHNKELTTTKGNKNREDQSSRFVSGNNVRSPVNSRAKYLDVTKQGGVFIESTAKQPNSPPSPGGQKPNIPTTTVISTQVKKPHIPATSHPAVGASNSIATSTTHSNGAGALDPPNRPMFHQRNGEFPKTKHPRSILKMKTQGAGQYSDGTSSSQGSDHQKSFSAQVTNRLGNGEFAKEPGKSILKNSELVHSSGRLLSSDKTLGGVSAFHLADSVEMSQKRLAGVRKVSEMQKVESTAKNRNIGSKPAWMIEAEKRQRMRGGKYEDPETRLKSADTSSNANNSGSSAVPAARVILTEINVNKSPDRWTIDTSAKPRTVSGVHNTNQEIAKNTSKAKPEWMREAERRIVERNGQYRDPEKHPVSKPADGLDGGKAALTPSSKSPTRPPPPRPMTSPISPRSPKSPNSPWSPAPNSAFLPYQPARSPGASPSESSAAARVKRPAPGRPTPIPVSATSPTHRKLVIPPPGEESPVSSPEERSVAAHTICCCPF